MRGRRVVRRTARRVMRRRWRRRILVGGMVLLAAGGTTAAIKMSQKDAQRVEERTGTSVEELTEDELVAAMQELGIKSIDLDDNDRAAIERETSEAPPAAAPVPQPVAAATPAAEPEPSYLDELERLAGLRDSGIITKEEFETKKKELLGL